MSGECPFTPGATMMAAGSDMPRMMLRLIASRSIATFNASRTRLSLNGFLPFTSEYFSSSLPWSRATKIVRTSWPSSTLSFDSLRNRATSGVGRSVSMSTSPDSSAATRVGSDLMGV